VREGGPTGPSRGEPAPSPIRHSGPARRPQPGYRRGGRALARRRPGRPPPRPRATRCWRSHARPRRPAWLTPSPASVATLTSRNRPLGTRSGQWATAFAPGAARVVTTHPYPVPHERTLDVGRAPALCTAGHLAGHAPVPVNQQRTLTAHDTPRLTRENSFSGWGPGHADGWAPRCRTYIDALTDVVSNLVSHHMSFESDLR